ncbi:CHAT domain-containing protein [candidate division KSB1 bacterium]|nr:CHAT domain-containing protein [candidate division KSB1 bacterium]
MFFKPTLAPPPKFVIIDSEESKMSRGRSEYAKMIDQLSQAQATCIAFDIYFTEESRYDSLGDQALVEMVKKYPHVVLAADFAPGKEPSATMMKLAEGLALPDSVCEEVFILQTFATGADLPFHNLLSVTKHLGHSNSSQNEPYHFPPVIAFHRKCYASLPLEMAKLYFAAKDSLFQLEDIRGYLDQDGQLLVNFIPTEKFKPYPYSWQEACELFQEQPDVFKDAIVFIVNPSEETELQTPLGKYPRWALLASLTSQLLLNNHIIEASELSAVFTAIFIFPGLTLFLFFGHRLKEKWRKTRFLFISGNIAILFLIFLTFRYLQTWLGVFVPLLAFNVSMGVMRARYYKLLKPPVYVDFGLAVLERQGQNYPMHVLTSPAGEEEINAFFPAFFEEESFQNALQKLKALQASRDDMKWIGDRLFDALFQNNIQYILKSSLNYVTGEDKYLRFSLRIDAPELACLPWELMHNSKMAPSFILLHKRISLARYLALEQPVRKPKFRVPLTILVFISSPSNLPPLDMKGEKKLLKKALRPLIWGGDVRVRFCEHATLDNLRNELERAPDILHYIGHSHYDAEKKEAFLDFVSDVSEADPVEVETLGGLLHESSVKLVVLNSCEGAVASDTDAFTGVAQNLVLAGVPAVVAMQYQVLDATATVFSSVFYSTFIKNYSVDAAIAEARRQIMAKTRGQVGQQGWATPVFFMRAHEGKIFNLDGDE